MGKVILKLLQCTLRLKRQHIVSRINLWNNYIKENFLANTLRNTFFYKYLHQPDTMQNDPLVELGAIWQAQCKIMGANKFFEQKREKVGQATRQPLGAAFTEGNCSEMTVYSKLWNGCTTFFAFFAILSIPILNRSFKAKA